MVAPQHCEDLILPVVEAVSQRALRGGIRQLMQHLPMRALDGRIRQKCARERGPVIDDALRGQLFDQDFAVVRDRFQPRRDRVVVKANVSPVERVHRAPRFGDCDHAPQCIRIENLRWLQHAATERIEQPNCVLPLLTEDRRSSHHAVLESVNRYEIVIAGHVPGHVLLTQAPKVRFVQPYDYALAASLTLEELFREVLLESQTSFKVSVDVKVYEFVTRREQTMSAHSFEEERLRLVIAGHRML